MMAELNEWYSTKFISGDAVDSAERWYVKWGFPWTETRKLLTSKGQLFVVLFFSSLF